MNHASLLPLNHFIKQQSEAEKEAAVRRCLSPWPCLIELCLSKTKAERTFRLTLLFERENRQYNTVH